MSMNIATIFLTDAPFLSKSLFVLALIQIAMMVFHAGSVFISIKHFDRKLDRKTSWILHLFCVCNMVCLGWRGYLFIKVGVTGHDLPFYTQIISPLLVLVTFVHLWFFVPLATSLPSIEQLQSLNKQLADKIAELENEKREKEKAQNALLLAQKLEAVGQLTGGLAHGYNNLLMAISGNLELIKRNPQSVKLDRWVGTGIDAVARAAHLTGQLLTFSRVQKLQIKEVELKPLLIRALETAKISVREGIEVVLGHVDDVVVLTDQAQLELAIVNLVENANDAIAGNGRMVLATQQVDDKVEICVTDSGTGISADIATRIFEPFFTTKDVGKGAGLGLSMVYGVATQSGGDVYIKHTSDQGTTLAIVLPVIRHTESIVPIASAIEPERTFIARDILIIDDDKAVRETLTEILTHLGHRVREVTSGVEALVVLESTTPDLLLVDYLMPKMNGAEFLKEARVLHPDVRSVFVTGFSESAQLENQIVLKKPFKIDDIQSLLSTLFA